MKIPVKGNSRFLSQEDLAAPIVAVMSHVTLERLKSARGEDDRFILHFVGNNIKPLKLNVTNQRVLVQAFGEESEGWRNKQVEIYADPNVTMGGEIVGGIRVRVPAAAPAPPLTRTPEECHRLVMNGFAGAPTATKLDDWRKWAEKQAFSKEQVQQQAVAFKKAADRLRQAPDQPGQPPRRPAA